MAMNRRFNCELRGASQRDYVVYGFCPGTTPSFLTAADYEWRQLCAATNIKRADTFGSVKLVTGDRKEVDRHLFQIYRQLRNCLNAINVKYCVRMFTNYLSNLFDGKQHARFVVGHHHRNDACIAS